jgi:hypothetical protein
MRRRLNVCRNKQGKKNEKPGKNLTIGEHNFEVVDEFKYLGTLINIKNSIPEEAKRRIVAANRSYYGLNKIFKSKHPTW